MMILSRVLATAQGTLYLRHYRQYLRGIRNKPFLRDYLSMLPEQATELLDKRYPRIALKVSGCATISLEALCTRLKPISGLG